MKKILISALFTTSILSTLSLCAADASKPEPAAVKALTKKVADWQISTFEEQQKYRALSSKIKDQVKIVLVNICQMVCKNLTNIF